MLDPQIKTDFKRITSRSLPFYYLVHKSDNVFDFNGCLEATMKLEAVDGTSFDIQHGASGCSVLIGEPFGMYLDVWHEEIKDLVLVMEDCDHGITGTNTLILLNVEIYERKSNQSRVCINDVGVFIDQSMRISPPHNFVNKIRKEYLQELDVILDRFGKGMKDINATYRP
jgi:hypothetical protein